MIMNKENWIQQVMTTMNVSLVEEYMKDNGVAEYEARRMLAEMYYEDMFERGD